MTTIYSIQMKNDNPQKMKDLYSSTFFLNFSITKFVKKKTDLKLLRDM